MGGNQSVGCKVAGVRDFWIGAASAVEASPLDGGKQMKVDLGGKKAIAFLNRTVEVENLEIDRVVFLPDQRTVLASVNGIGRVVIAAAEAYDALAAAVMTAVDAEVKRQADGGFKRFQWMPGQDKKEK